MKPRAQTELDAAYSAMTQTIGKADTNNYPFLVGFHEGTIKRLCEEIASLTNEGVSRERGFHYVEASLDDLPVMLQCEYDPGEHEVRYYKDGSGHPGSPAYAEVVGVWVAGACISPDAFSEKQLDLWNTKATEEVCEAEAEKAWDDQQTSIDEGDHL